MLKSLSITNMVLIESAHLNFDTGLTVLTGETGTGKSAILKALDLALGARADGTFVRRGCQKGRVEAAFDVRAMPAVLTLLEEAGIDQEAGEELIISREIPSKGTSRAFINQQMVQGAFLKTITSHLLDLVGQSANIRLTSASYPLETLDLYGHMLEKRKAYQKSFKACRELRLAIEQHALSAAERLRRETRLRVELQEIEEIAPLEGEEETLFQEYTTLSHSEELSRLCHASLGGLQEEEKNAQSLLVFCQKQLEQMAQIDPQLMGPCKTIEGVLMEVRELSYHLQGYRGKIEYNPQRMETLQTRLAQLDRLQKKVGPDVVAHKKKLENELNEVSGSEDKIASLKKILADTEIQCQKLAQDLTKTRTEVAKKLQDAVTAQLRPLNLQEAQFEIRLQSIPLNHLGGDAVEFFFAPNVGEGSVPVRKCASGGELSRLLLALKTALSGLERTPTLIFDEIDTGMGGETAGLVGQKLKMIAKGRQVLCITHLPQVAMQADHHFAIEKQEEGGRTYTLVSAVTGEARDAEIVRMQGGQLGRFQPAVL